MNDILLASVPILLNWSSISLWKVLLWEYFLNDGFIYALRVCVSREYNYILYSKLPLLNNFDVNHSTIVLYHTQFKCISNECIVFFLYIVSEFVIAIREFYNRKSKENTFNVICFFLYSDISVKRCQSWYNLLQNFSYNNNFSLVEINNERRNILFILNIYPILKNISSTFLLNEIYLTFHKWNKRKTTVRFRKICSESVPLETNRAPLKSPFEKSISKMKRWSDWNWA